MKESKLKSEPITPGSLIRDILEEREMSAFRLGQLIAAGKDTAGKIVSTGGETMSLQTFRSICAALQIHPSEVLDQLPPVELPEPRPILRRGPKTKIK